MKAVDVRIEEVRKDQDMWRRFHNGDHLETVEIRYMIKQAEKGLEYLEGRGEAFYLATFKTRLDVERLRGYLQARTERNAL